MSIIKEMVKIAYNALDDKQGEDIRIIDISGISVMADYFIIAHGNNPNHVRTLMDFTEEKLN
ncbi:MAG: ribosome silencing factor, partial [Firmicutes bacterium HGW-Firmicutes-5]